jgi:hypothetical protein
MLTRSNRKQLSGRGPLRRMLRGYVGAGADWAGWVSDWAPEDASGTGVGRWEEDEEGAVVVAVAAPPPQQLFFPDDADDDDDDGAAVAVAVANAVSDVRCRFESCLLSVLSVLELLPSVTVAVAPAAVASCPPSSPAGGHTTPCKCAWCPLSLLSFPSPVAFALVPAVAVELVALVGTVVGANPWGPLVPWTPPQEKGSKPPAAAAKLTPPAV